MARKDGFYKVTHHKKVKIMKWTTTNDDNTKDVSGYWNGDGYTGNDHDMSFINEKMLTDKEVLRALATFDKQP